jgi:periplasmic copper chaperone A
MKITAVVIAAVTALLTVQAAAAHVTLNPREAAAESFARFAVRVPTERDNATVEVTVQLPEGLFFVSFQPKAGWKRTVKMEKLDQPVEIFGDQITERVARVTWSGGKIQPGEFDEFGMSARMPEETGELVFPSIQTYESGEVVRWIGPPDSETPAPIVTVTPAQEEGAQPAAAPPPPPAAAPEETAGEEEEGTDSLAVVALILGIAGLAAGLGALALAWNRSPRRAAATRS